MEGLTIKFLLRVTKYWPELGQNGKEEITLADILRHESGLAWLDHSFEKDDFYPENIKKNKAGVVFENESLHLPQVGGVEQTPTTREYHTVTRGCMLNEIVRRVHPEGLTIGEIIRRDPNFEGIFLGLNDSELGRCADETDLPHGKILQQSLLLKSMGRGIEPNVFQFMKMFLKGKKLSSKVAQRPAFMVGIPKMLSRAVEIVNEPFFRKAELPSANFHASAKALAKLGSMMAHHGEALHENDARLMSQETWQKMHANEKRAFDAAMHSKLF